MTRPSQRLLRVAADGPGQESRPPADRVIAGDPVHTTWSVEERDGVYAGVWQSTPGSWRVLYDEWEYCRILSGRSVIVGDDGSEMVLGPGDSTVIRPGFSGVWTVEQTTQKDYVIVMINPS